MTGKPDAGGGSSTELGPSPELRRARLRALFVALVIGALFVVVQRRLEVSTEITHFLPAGEDARLARLSRALTEADAARVTLVSVEAASTPVAARCARELADAMRAEPGVGWLQSGIDERLQTAFYDTYFPRRFAFAFGAEEARRPVTDEELRAAATRLRDALTTPMGSFAGRLAPEDPLGFFLAQLDALRTVRGEGVTLEEGQLVSADGRHGLFLYGSTAPPFDVDAQSALGSRLEARFRELQAREPGCARLEHTSVGRFAASAQASIRADIERISVLSTVAITAVFLLLFRSVRFVLLGMVPLVAGSIVAMAASLLAFGKIHGITLAFGSSLLGVGIDYAEHYFTHHTLHPDPRGPQASFDRVWTGLWMGAVTTVAGLAGLAGTSFPGIREIAFFSVVAVLASLLATRWLLPPFVPAKPRDVPLQRRLAHELERVLEQLRGRRRMLAALLGLTVVVSALGLPRVRAIDDVAALNTLDPRLVAEDAAVRARFAGEDDGPTLVVSGPDEESALEALESVLPALEGARRDGLLERYGSVAPFLRSARLQKLSSERLRQTPDLEQRVARAFEAEGFVPQRLAPFFDALRASEPPPLTWTDLRATPLGEVVRPLRLDAEGRVGWIVTLGRVRDTTRLKERLAPFPAVDLVDQRSILETAYGRFRKRTVEMTVLGLLVVFVVVHLRYRRLRLSAAAFVPAVLAALVTVSLHGLAGVPLNLLHLIGLLLVLSMGVDYGIFVVEGRAHPRDLGAALLSVLVATVSTLVSFGLLALSRNPALASLGTTTAIGITLSAVLAPTTLLLLRGHEAHEPR